MKKGVVNSGQCYTMKLTGLVKKPDKGGCRMNEQFYELPQEKQMRIINAALEVFAGDVIWWVDSRGSYERSL